ncbi:hypothetical protein, partial [Streptococcus pneumoniae]|uniref:hypothetical protein n=1 Tax=Streptococcus pneumoniae TaxID=1313 RepID=UPI001E53C61E
TATVVQIGVTVGLATVSYRLLEQPIRSGDRVLEWRRWAIPLSMATLILVLVWGLPKPDRTKISALDEVRDLVVPTAPV